MQILAISGSLRAKSSHTGFVRAAALLAPPNVDVIIYFELGDLPHFNPDLDSELPPPAVAAFRARLKAADAVLICSPEYAHGVPGSLKNALDWVVGNGEFMEKPFALVSLSPRSTFAQAQLTEILTTMMARIVPEASSVLPLAGKNMDAEAIAAHPEFSVTIHELLTALASACEKKA